MSITPAELAQAIRRPSCRSWSRPDAAIISDALNHNCIINAARLAQPKEKHVYAHLDLSEFEDCLRQAAGCERVFVVTDGIFSMRGDHAPLAEIKKIAARYLSHPISSISPRARSPISDSQRELLLLPR